ncbi:MAG: TIGR03668 family PPOX class F420-dependent oxidoreductase [SAR202 cluster bacterium]|nr:TIGR03668 family PPOX class F420-dependent oxidoreductase [SAR202 cluster bacterium]
MVCPLSPAQAARLAQAPIARLATADAAGQPHVIPVCYAFDGQHIYSVLDQKPKRAPVLRLRRVRNIQTNPQVSLVVDHYDPDWRHLWYLLITGAAQVLEPGAEQAGAIALLRQKYPQYQQMDIGGNPVIKITPAAVVAWGDWS